MPRQQWRRAGAGVLVAALISLGGIDAAAAQGTTIFQATIGESGQKTPEVSTEEVRRVLADGSAIVLDSRKRSEYVAGHIAGAKNVALEAGAPPSAIVGAVEGAGTGFVMPPPELPPPQAASVTAVARKRMPSRVFMYQTLSRTCDQDKHER